MSHRAFVVVRDHFLPDGAHGVELIEGDVIKIGRIPYYVKEVNYASGLPVATETESESSEVSEIDHVKKIMSNFPPSQSFIKDNRRKKEQNLIHKLF
jgi:hypothetical protein